MLRIIDLIMLNIFIMLKRDNCFNQVIWLYIFCSEITVLCDYHIQILACVSNSKALFQGNPSSFLLKALSCKMLQAP